MTVFHVLHPDEVDFPFDGNVKFDGLEVPEEIMTRPHLIRPGVPAGRPASTWTSCSAAATRTASTTCGWTRRAAGADADEVPGDAAADGRL